MIYWGELAALGTAFCWSFTAVFFAEAGKRIGSFRVNQIRLLIAVGIYIIILLITTGRLFPADLTFEQIAWLSLSGIIGLVIGDGAGFKGLVMLGPRLGTLLWASAPIMATAIAWLLLGEKLGLIDLAGILITLGGIGWVVAERKHKSAHTVADDHPDAGTKLKGVMLSLLAAFGQAAGLVMSKHAMLNLGGELDAMPASFVRIVAALVVIWTISGLRGRLGYTLKAIRPSSGLTYTFGGAFMGPFLGVWLSLVAVKMIPAGISATLNAMTPILIIPVVIFFYKEHVSPRAILGAVLAVFGVVMLFLGDEILRLIFH